MISRCTHLRINGARCTSPAVNGKDLCFSHESRWLRMRVKACPPSAWVTTPLVSFVYPEDHDAILENIHAITRAFAHQMIDYRQASALDRLMNTALRTLRQARKLEDSAISKEMIRSFRLDSDGNPRALPDADDSSAQAMPTPAASTPAVVAQQAESADAGGDIPTIAAVAEDEDEDADAVSDEANAKLRPSINRLIVFHSPSPEVESLITSAIATLTRPSKVKTVFSNTYVLRGGKLRLERRRRAQEAVRSNQIAKLLALYSKLG